MRACVRACVRVCGGVWVCGCVCVCARARGRARARQDTDHEAPCRECCVTRVRAPQGPVAPRCRATPKHWRRSAGCSTAGVLSSAPHACTHTHAHVSAHTHTHTYAHPPLVVWGVLVWRACLVSIEAAAAGGAGGAQRQQVVQHITLLACALFVCRRRTHTHTHTHTQTHTHTHTQSGGAVGGAGVVCCTSRQQPRRCKGTEPTALLSRRPPSPRVIGRLYMRCRTPGRWASFPAAEPPPCVLRPPSCMVSARASTRPPPPSSGGDSAPPCPVYERRAARGDGGGSTAPPWLLVWPRAAQGRLRRVSDAERRAMGMGDEGSPPSACSLLSGCVWRRGVLQQPRHDVCACGNDCARPAHSCDPTAAHRLSCASAAK
jgi:hypothetical protein